MNYYEHLLFSFELIKQRKFKVISEAANKASAEAEAKAKHYVQQAISYSNTDNYIVAIPELGANAKIFVARNGKQKGNVVVDNVIGMYPIAVTDGTGSPTKGPAWYQFVGRFNKLMSEPSVPQQPEQPQIPGMMPVMSDTSMQLMNAGNSLAKLAQDNKFFTLSKGLTSPIWMNPGPNNDFPEIQRRIFGPDPFSLESKINMAQSIKTDPISKMKVAMPLDENEKSAVIKNFVEFTKKINKIYVGTFTEEDASWIHNRFINDREGFWIKDPVILPDGISLSWRYSKSDPQHGFFRHMILAYNKAYKQWAYQYKLEPKYTIADTNAIFGPLAAPKDFNSVRGKSAEDLRIALNFLSNGDTAQAAQMIQQVSQEYGMQLQMAYDYAIPYMEGYAAADVSIIDTTSLIKELEKLEKTQIDPTTVVQQVLPKLAWLEKYSTLIRQPMAIDSVADVVGIGKVADLVEHYTDESLINDTLVSNYGFDLSEALEMTAGGSLNVGLKTYLSEGDAVLTSRSLSYLFANIHDINMNPFIATNLARFNLSIDEVKNYSTQVQKISQLLNTVLADITIPGMPSKALNKSNFKLIINKIGAVADYKDLVQLGELEQLDIDNKDTKQKVKNLLENRMVTALFKTKTKKLDDGTLTPEAQSWRRYLGLVFFAGAGADKNQLTEIRYLKQLKSVAINHNKALLDPIADFIAGNVDLDMKAKSSLSLFNAATRRRYLKLEFSWYQQEHNRNHALFSLNKVYTKSIGKTPKVNIKEAGESVGLVLKSLQKALTKSFHNV